MPRHLQVVSTALLSAALLSAALGLSFALAGATALAAEGAGPCALQPDPRVHGRLGNREKSGARFSR